jgi:hypothetical protein
VGPRGLYCYLRTSGGSPVYGRECLPRSCRRPDRRSYPCTQRSQRPTMGIHRHRRHRSLRSLCRRGQGALGHRASAARGHQQRATRARAAAADGVRAWLCAFPRRGHPDCDLRDETGGPTGLFPGSAEPHARCMGTWPRIVRLGWLRRSSTARRSRRSRGSHWTGSRHCRSLLALPSGPFLQPLDALRSSLGGDGCPNHGSDLRFPLTGSST